MRYVVALAVFLSLGGCSGKQPEVSAADRLKRYEELNRLVEREGEKLYHLEQATQAAVPPVGTPAGQEWEKAPSWHKPSSKSSTFACAKNETWPRPSWISRKSRISCAHS